MEESKQQRLEAAGWKVGNAEDFLELSKAEVDFIALKLSLSKNLIERRKSLMITQKEFAGMINSSQSRVAKMETCDPGVSLYLLVKSLLVLKARKEDVEQMLP